MTLAEADELDTHAVVSPADPVVGQRCELENVYRREYGNLVGAARLMTGGGTAAAEDIVQDVFATIYALERPLSDGQQLAGYVYRSVVNACRTSARLNARRLEIIKANAAAMSPAARTPDASTDALVVASAIARLPLKQREAVVCHYLLGLTHAETAKALGARVGTVKTHLKRGRHRLAAELGEENPP